MTDIIDGWVVPHSCTGSFSAQANELQQCSRIARWRGRSGTMLTCKRGGRFRPGRSVRTRAAGN